MDHDQLESHGKNRSPRQLWNRAKNKFTTREGLIGDYNYSYLFTPRLPFSKQKPKQPVFFALDSHMPVLLGLLLGLQHCLAMLAGLVTPALIIAPIANLDAITTQYLVSASLLVSGFLSLIQITRFKLFKTKYYIGTGLISVVGTSFATITIVTKSIPQMYANGFCPVDSDGTQLPCPDAYGAIIGTAAVCGLIEIALSFLPPRVLKRVFPPIVTGPVVLLIGVSLIQSGFEDWMGGSGCVGATCPGTGDPQAAPWGSAKFFGLGFLVLTAIIISEKWGAPIMQSCAVIIGLLVGCIVAAACGYFDRSTIDEAPVVTFLWVHRFKLTVYGPIVLPMLAIYITLMMEAIGDVTATCDVSQLSVEGPMYESRIQGGVLADGTIGILAALMTVTPMSTFAQNNGVISLTRCANKNVGYWCCFFLIIMGIFSKFAASLVAIPKPVLGGMTTFLFSSVAVSGLRIISSIPFTRRDRFVLTCTSIFGFGAVLVPDYFSYVFTYSGDNHALQGFLDAIELVMETTFAVAGIVGLIVNLIIPEPEPDADMLLGYDSKTEHFDGQGGSEPEPESQISFEKQVEV